MNDAMHSSGFNYLSGAAIGALGLGTKPLWERSLIRARLADSFTEHLPWSVPHATIRSLYARMFARRWSGLEDDGRTAVTVTNDGVVLLLAAFKALSRLADEGQGAIEFSLLLSLANKRLPNDD